jgi:CheY-like chemotaxis protein
MAFSPVVLVVEDDELVQAMIAEGLQTFGFDVLTAKDGPEALAAAAEAAILDVVVADVRLPGPLTGVDVARRLRAARPNLTVIYSSGFGQAPGTEDMVPECLFLPKPFTMAQLASVIETMLVKRFGVAPDRAEQEAPA